ncbi:MAG TPA: 2-phosphosulfolactate phosphatase [Longimicrobiales bacterium]|nr:2-phosphosulfolactate phosphatase [Longimicrobiales bacterium]
MKIDTYFTVNEVEPADLLDTAVVVIDVVRATTTMVEAIANGARGIFPTESTEDAVKLAHGLGREDTLLCGERRGQKIEGFHLGNSPREFTREAVQGKRLVMSTSNGTRAFAVGHEGSRLLACAFTNLGATARALGGVEELAVICAGGDDRFGIDDALCAGHLLQRLLDGTDGEHTLNDAARAALLLASSRKPTKKLLAETEAGRILVEIGLGDDLDICADVDRHDVVVEMRDQTIVKAAS